MYIFSEKTNQKYNTVEECVAAEQAWDEEQVKEKERKKKLDEDRKIRDQEVESAFKKAYELLDNFTKDYGSFHFTVKGHPNIFDIFNWAW